VNKIFAIGESAGGHLCALIGTTGNLKEFQPPECINEDTSVFGAIPLYGLYDLMDEKRHSIKLNPVPFGLQRVIRGGLTPFVSRVLIQKPIQGNEKDFYLASPTYHVKNKHSFKNEKDDLPIFLILHGTKDVLASFEDTKDFYHEIQLYRRRSNSTKNDIFLPVQDGHHAIGYIPSPRSNACADSVYDWVMYHHNR